ncbi:MAG: c-type cytochrome [Geminicoccaceae bacterium]
MAVVDADAPDVKATLAALAAALLVVGCGCLGHRASEWRAGRQIYTLHCSSCHQPNGRGYDDVYPPLAGNPIVRLSDPEPVIDVVVRGRGSMPPFGEELTPTQIADVVTYIRRTWGNHASRVDPRQAG